jgi:peptidoglycan/LPS O-acetylase OafA/YrhL
MARFPERGVARLLNTTPFVTVGVLSYSLYLWHRLFLRPEAWQSWWDFPLNIVLLGIVATLSYVLIERPFLRLKDHQVSAGRTIPRVAAAN